MSDKNTNKTTKPESASVKNDNLYSCGPNSLKEHRLPDVCHAHRGLPRRAIASDTNLRSGFNRYDQDAARPDDKLPTEHGDIILACQSIYRKVGMVRNIIDLMTDFAAEGLELQHPIKSQEKFFREWARRVNLSGRAHDFMKLLMRDANVIVRRKNAILSIPMAQKMAKGGVSITETVDETIVTDIPTKVDVPKAKHKKREIPWKYTFISPVIVEKIGDDVGRFFGSDDLGMRIPTSLANSINNPSTNTAKKFLKELPPEIIRAAKNSGRLIKLDMSRIYVDYYKKDDWEDWGTPFLYGVLEDVMFKEKMRLADMAALDGVINVIRIWKLGKSDSQILPTPAAVDKLIDILQHNVGGGVMDLVWDDMIDLQVEYPPIDKILGADKYQGVNTDIVRGLGIPDSLIGGADLGTRNAQSAFVQLKTLVERLEYVRSRAIRWMDGELRLVADAMGFKRIPAVNFGIMSLRDEAAEKQLIIQLLDRGIISSEKVTEVFGVNYGIELERMRTEQTIRDNSSGILEKSNPYNRPFSVMEKQNELAIELERVKQNCSDSGTSEDDNGGGDNPNGDQPRDDGNNSPGKPPSTTDTKVRDTRTPKTLSTLYMIGFQYLDQIDKLINKNYLKSCKAKNMRLLTKEQKLYLERVKRGILSVLRPGDMVTNKLIAERLSDVNVGDSKLENVFNRLIGDFTSSTNDSPTFTERKVLTATAWADFVNDIDR